MGVSYNLYLSFISTGVHERERGTYVKEGINVVITGRNEFVIYIYSCIYHELVGLLSESVQGRVQPTRITAHSCGLAIAVYCAWGLFHFTADALPTPPRIPSESHLITRKSHISAVRSACHQKSPGPQPWPDWPRSNTVSSCEGRVYDTSLEISLPPSPTVWMRRH